MFQHRQRGPAARPSGTHPDDAGSVALRGGRTRYLVEGRPDGAPLVLLHGATVPAWQFDVVAPILGGDGFRTLRFDFYGHGRSERAPAAHSIELFAQQTLEMIEAAGFPHPFTLLGHSMGAAVAAAVAAARPDWVERLVLIAPLMRFELGRRWSLGFRCPGVGELLMRHVGLPALLRRRTARYRAVGRPELAERFLAETSYPVLGKALLSMLRKGALGPHASRYRRLAGFGHDVLVIWGNRDVVIPRDDVDRIRALLPGHRYVEIEDAQHNVLVTHAAEVAAAVRAFVRE